MPRLQRIELSLSLQASGCIITLLSDTLIRAKPLLAQHRGKRCEQAAGQAGVQQALNPDDGRAWAGPDGCDGDQWDGCGGGVERDDKSLEKSLSDNVRILSQVGFHHREERRTDGGEETSLTVRQ